MRNYLLLFLLGIIFLLTGCDPDNNSIDEPGNGNPIETFLLKELLNGHVQKGPFDNGSSVTVIELDSNLNQTGRVYITSITNNRGSFEQKNIKLISNFIQLKADGYYFNEVNGDRSDGQVSLTALADIRRDTNTVNINVLTHLERARVEYLVQQESISFATAKQQAQQEVLNIFGFSISEIAPSESFDLTGNAILLAISCILQGPFSTGDMVELMANISTDICTDGLLDDITLGTKLIDNANSISLTKVRSNLENKYAELGIEVNIPDFESLVQSFVKSELYPITSLITYPPVGLNGESNILSDNITSVKQSTLDVPNYYCMTAEIPKGLSLKIVLKGGNWYYVIPTLNWQVGDPVNDQQEFTVIETKTEVESEILNEIRLFIEQSSLLDENNQPYILIEYYEGITTVPTKTKKLYIETE